MFFIFCQAATFYIGKEFIIQFFTEDENVAEILRKAWFLFLLCNFIETVSIIGGSVMNATLNQKASIILGFISCFLIGLPLAYLLSFPCEMGVNGIWLGHSQALIFLTLSFNIIIARVNYEKLVEKIRERAR